MQKGKIKYSYFKVFVTIASDHFGFVFKNSNKLISFQQFWSNTASKVSFAKGRKMISIIPKK